MFREKIDKKISSKKLFSFRTSLQTDTEMISLQVGVLKIWSRPPRRRLRLPSKKLFSFMMSLQSDKKRWYHFKLECGKCGADLLEAGWHCHMGIRSNNRSLLPSNPLRLNSYHLHNLGWIMELLLYKTRTVGFWAWLSGISTLITEIFYSCLKIWLFFCLLLLVLCVGK